MLGRNGVRTHLLELVVIFVGVGLAFAVENLREDLNDDAVALEHLAGFQEDLQSDLVMLDEQIRLRAAQRDGAETALSFFDGRPLDVQLFFESFWAVLPGYNVIPSRNTMDEVLNSGSLRLVRDSRVRDALLDLYAVYARISFLEAHMARDYDRYLYDPTFSSIPFKYQGPWGTDPSDLAAAQIVLDNLTIENGLRLAAINIGGEAGLLELLASARAKVLRLLDLIPVDHAA